MHNEPSFRTVRAKRLFKAVSTALLSKGASVLLQLVSIPLAIRILGPEQYGLYAIATSFLALFAFAQVGAGPALVRNLAAAETAGDRPGERRLLLSALIAITLGFLLIALGYAIFVSTGLAQRIMGVSLQAHFSEIRLLIWLCLWATLLIMVGNIFSSVLTGFQLQHIANLLGIVGITLSAVGIIIAMKMTPSVISFVTILYGGQIAGLMLCVVWLWRRRPDLFKWRHSGVSFGDIRSFIAEGLAFTLIQIGSMLQREIAKMALSGTLGLVTVGRIAALFQLLMILAGLLTMLSVPLFPALVEAKERGDLKWVQTALKRLMLAVLVGGVLFVFLFWLMGDQVCRELYGGRFGFSSNERLAFSIYFILLAVAHVILIGLTALGCVRFASVLAGAEIVTMLILLLIFGAHGIGQVLWLLSVPTAIFTVLIGAAGLLQACVKLREGLERNEAVAPKSMAVALK